MVYARDTNKPDASFAKFGVRNAADHEKFRKGLQRELEAELATSRKQGHHTWVISSEHLHSKIISPEMIGRLHALLAPMFDDITIYLHLRPQVDLLVSNSSQRARMGRPVTRADLTRDAVSTNSSYFNYNKIVGHWEDVFGASNMRLMPFRRKPGHAGLYDRDAETGHVAPGTGRAANRGLDWRAISLANVIAGGFEALNMPAVPDFHLDGMPGTDRLQLGRALAQDLQSRFDASNRKLVARRSDVTLDDLTPDWSSYTEDSNLSLIEAPCLFAEQLTYMVRRFAKTAPSNVGGGTWPRGVWPR